MLFKEFCLRSKSVNCGTSAMMLESISFIPHCVTVSVFSDVNPRKSFLEIYGRVGFESNVSVSSVLAVDPSQESAMLTMLLVDRSSSVRPYPLNALFGMEVI